ncbi:MAG: hypothetical protein GY754_28270 [bacterium]|nr:hypothetical protein [bacterium]
MKKSIKKTACLAFFFAAAAFLFGCGGIKDKLDNLTGSDDGPRFTLNGRITVESSDKAGNYGSAPHFVAVSRSESIEDLRDNPEENVVQLIYVHDINKDFIMDITDTDLLPGDEVFLFAFMDNDYSEGSPSLKEGDVVGFYRDPVTLNTSYKIKASGNYIEININREVYDYEAVIAGTLNCEESGDIFLIAFSGDIADIDLANLDIDQVVGFKRFFKEAGTFYYSLPVIPCGFNLPIEEVHVVAVLDLNENSKPDEGDKIGYYVNKKSLSPKLTVTGGLQDGIDIDICKSMSFEGSKAQISGTVTGNAYGKILLVAYDGQISSFDMNSVDMNKIIGYEVIEKTEASANYTMRTLPFSNLPAESVTVVALFDKDGNKEATEGDMLGFYTEPNGDGTPAFLTITEGSTEGIDINIDKTYYDHNARIQGTISGNAKGDLHIIAYNGDIRNIDINNLDTDCIVGYEKVSKSSFSLDYRMNVLPFFDLPLDVSLIAFVDLNKNGKPDSGDSVGYYMNKSSMSFSIAVSESGVSGINFSVNKTVYENNASVSFRMGYETINIPFPQKWLADGEEVLVFLVHKDGVGSGYNIDIDYLMGLGSITKAKDDGFMGGFAMNTTYSVKFFPFINEKIPVQYGNGGSTFKVDDVNLFAVYDKNKNGLPDKGENIGFLCEYVYQISPYEIDITNNGDNSTTGSLNTRRLRFFLFQL